MSSSCTPDAPPTKIDWPGPFTLEPVAAFGVQIRPSEVSPAVGAVIAERQIESAFEG